MLSQYTKISLKNTKTGIVAAQRRIILVLLTLLTIVAIVIVAKIAFDISKQKHAEDIVISAKNEASKILGDAKSHASVVAYNTAKDANKKAETITESAETKADTITKTAEVKADTITKTAEIKADTITKTAEVKANKIVDNAINVKIDDVETLLAITEAEAANQPVKGKAAVAATIKNRVKSVEFKADTIKEVVYAPGQFDPVSNGTINRVSITASTIEGVKLCLEGNDYSNGALYFFNPTISRGSNVRWLNTLQTTAVIGDHVFKK